jgi:hypothetical protein
MSLRQLRSKLPALLLAALGLASVANAQVSDQDEEVSARESAAEKYKELTDPERMLEKRKKITEKVKPPFEFFRSQVAPFDVLPYVKAGQWNTISLDLRANLADFEGILETSPVRLVGMPHEIRFRRNARLLKEQQGKLSLQMMLPQVTKEIGLELTQPNAVRGEAGWKASLLRLEPHQMLIPILSLEPNDYQGFTKLPCMLPFSGDTDANAIDRNRYYRLVIPLAPEKGSLLSTHPLTWSAISHVIWDNYNPDLLNVGQQSAMIDWLHWGGQLVIVGGAGPSLTPLQDSFLGPYLPAYPSGKNALLTDPELEALSEAFPPPTTRGAWERSIDGDPNSHGQAPPRYQPPSPIHVAPGKSIYLTGLTPLEGSTSIPLNDAGGHLIGVERRVGRGRIMMLTFKPTDPALLKWEGLTTFIQRIVLQRPDESNWDSVRHGYPMLGGPDLSSLRYLGRDLGAPAVAIPQGDAAAMGSSEFSPPRLPVASWLDFSEMPVRTKGALEKASGITIPGSNFVLSIVLGYILALVPLNWLLCRFVLRRKELAWVFAPILAFGFAIAVERAAAYDMGFDSACDEVDLLEIQGDYHRAHLSRFNALYSTGRTQFTISYPNNPTALALPMDMGRGLRGDAVVHSIWQTTPEPALIDLPVQPRSLAMFRAEEMVNLPGGCTLSKQGDSYSVLNSTNLELRDAVLVRVAAHNQPQERYKLGTLAAGAEAKGVKLEPVAPKRETADTRETAPTPDWVTIVKTKNAVSSMKPAEQFLELLRSYDWNRPEDAGEWRLVAWSPKTQPGQTILPKVDRTRGFQLVVAHLSYNEEPPATKSSAEDDSP